MIHRHKDNEAPVTVANGEDVSDHLGETNHIDQPVADTSFIDLISRLKRLSRVKLLRLARSWSDECDMQESQMVSLPKAWGANKKKLTAVLPDISNKVIVPLIEICRPVTERPNDDNFYICEGF